MSTPTAPAVQLAPGQFERIAKALADGRRFAMLESIANNDDCPYQRLCSDFPISKATVSHHMKELVTAGLVESRREGQYLHYCVRRDTLQAYTAELYRRAGGRPEPKHG